MRLKGVLPGLSIAGVSGAPGGSIKNTSNDVIDSTVEIELPEVPVEPAAGVCQDILVGEKRWTGTLIPESVMDGQVIDYAKVGFKPKIKKYVTLAPLVEITDAKNIY